jgi:small conductance mechanosensitive channel
MLLLAAGSLAPSIAVAQAADGATDAAAELPDERRIDALIQTLKDPDARKELIDKLQMLTEVHPASGTPAPKSVDDLSLGLIELVRSRIKALAIAAVDLSSVIVDLPDLSDWLWIQVTVSTYRDYWVEMIGTIALMFLGALIAYRGVRRLIRPSLLKFEREQPANIVSKLPIALLRAAIRCLPIVAFAIVGYSVIPFLRAEEATAIVAKSMVDATIVCLVLTLATRTLLAPSVPQLRLLEMADNHARYLYRWLKRFIYLIAYSYVIFQNELLLKIPLGVYGGIERGLGLIVAGMVIYLVLRNRRKVAHWLRGNGHDAPDNVQKTLSACRRLVADIWPVFAIFYVVSTYLIWALDLPGGFSLLLRGTILTTLLLAISRPLAYGVERMLGEGLSLSPEIHRRYPALEHRVNRYLSLIQGFAVSLVYFIILLALVHVWGFNLFTWIASLFTDETWAKLTSAATVILVTFVVWEVVSLLIENYLQAIDEHGTRVERSGRARTLLPLARTFLFLVILIVVTLSTLSTLGIDVTPVLAAAGVVGIAIGFGSQKLVQDIITGLFILFQDTIAVGEVVDVAGHSGLVENITVRTISLRDLSGRVHTIPFSEVTTITNHTKGFSYAEFDIGIAYREDVDEVMDVIRQIGAELEANPEFGQHTLAPIEVLGVNGFADSAVIIKARFKTKAMKQWYIKREFNRLMKYRFDELGIEIPFPHQTIYFGEDKAGRAPRAHVAIDADPEPAAEPQTAKPPFRLVGEEAAASGERYE